MKLQYQNALLGFLLRQWLCLNSGSASFKGPGLCFEGESLKAASIVVKWNGHQLFLPLHYHFFRPGPRNLCHAMFLPFLFVRLKSLGIWEAVKGSSGASSKKVKGGKRRPYLWAAFGEAFILGQPSHGIVAYLAFKCGLRRMQTLNHKKPHALILLKKVSPSSQSAAKPITHPSIVEICSF